MEFMAVVLILFLVSHSIWTNGWTWMGTLCIVTRFIDLQNTLKNIINTIQFNSVEII